MTTDDILKDLTVRHAVTEELLLTLIAGLPGGEEGYIEALTGYLTATYRLAEQSAITAPDKMFARAAGSYANHLTARLRDTVGGSAELAN